MTKSIKVDIPSGALKNAVDQLAGELEERDDVFDTMTAPEVCRRLIAYAIREQRKGRGPWPIS